MTGSLADTAKAQSLPNYDNPRTFFIDQAAVPTRSSTECEPCPVCEGLHYVWNCRNFIENSTSDRWKIAKRFQLCFRCLTEGHHGKSCQRSSQCGQNGCLELHHRLLHRQHKRNSRGSRTKPGVLNRNNNNHLTALQFRFPEQFISIMEGNDRCTEGNDRCTEGNKLYTEGNDRCMDKRIAVWTATTAQIGTNASRTARILVRRGTSTSRRRRIAALREKNISQTHR